MSSTGILLTGCDAETSRIAVEVSRLMFSDPVVSTANSTEEALNRKPAAGMELLVLAAPSPTEVTKAVEASDGMGLPRWAVVVLSANPTTSGGAEVLSPEEWNGRLVRRAFRSAMAQHALRREVTRARGDLLAIGSRVTHDLRTQVAGILATSELLREMLADEEPSRVELTEPIFESVDGLGKIIERLSFLAIASGRGAVKKPLDMGDIVFQALQRLDREILEKSASVVGPTLWPEVMGEAAWIEKIWLNLVANSLNHGGERLQIELGWKQENGELQFWIRDNGVGVPAGKRSQLFQPFHLMHRTNSPKGLGLPIVQRLVEMQGGRCGYEPREGGGAEFFFTIPEVNVSSTSPPSLARSEKSAAIAGNRAVG